MTARKKAANVKRGRSNRKRGRAFELKIIKDLWMYFEGRIPWKKHASPDDGFSPPPDFADCHLEMKKQEKLNIWAACKQAEEDAKKKKQAAWVVVFTRARHKQYVALDYETWKQLAYHWSRSGTKVGGKTSKRS